MMQATTTRTNTPRRAMHAAVPAALRLRNTTRYEYNRANRLIREVRPMGEATAYEYDANGNLTTRTNAKGEQRRYTYDIANRRIKEEHFAAGTGTAARTITYERDERGQLTSYNDSGEAGRAEGNSANYTYDAKGEMTQEVITYQTPGGSFGKTLQTTYYANGLKKRFTYPVIAASGGVDGGSVDYTYDANGQLKTVTLPGNRVINYDSYNWFAPIRKSVPGSVTTLAYDALMQPARIKSQALYIPGGAGGTADAPQGPVLIDYRYRYNEVGNIRAKGTRH